ncbi:Hsp20/alpha crystallin family protein [Patescibacteria group bacterium]|nr:Hsp20/alpha crystallin family protein [Patescibacteria group bacterium]
MKNFWGKISGLDKEILEKKGEEITVVYKEKAQKSKKFLLQEKKEEAEQEQWISDTSQGQLVVDIYEKDEALIIESTIAGVKAQDIDITIEPDLIVIRGERKKPKTAENRRYYYQECFWGKFSRTLILPFPIKPDQVKANFKNGMLIIFLPMAEEKSKQVQIEE